MIGSRDAVLHQAEPLEPTKDDPETPRATEESPRLRARPSVLMGATYRAATPVGTSFITINRGEDGSIAEVFVTVGRAGSDVAADAEALGRLISLALRIPSVLPPREVAEAVVDQLQGIGGGSPLGFGSARVRSLADAVAKVLAEYLGATSDQHDSSALSHAEPVSDVSSRSDDREKPVGRVGNFCPSCGQVALVYQEGCNKCYACGFSSC